MRSLIFTARQETVDGDLLLHATLDGKSIGVRITQEAVEDHDLESAQDKAVEKAKLGQFEPNGTITVRTTDFT